MAATSEVSVSWVLEGDLDIFSLQQQASRIKALLEPGKGLIVDLSSMGDMDPSGLQLLLSLQKTLTAGGHSFLITGASDSLRERLLGLGVKDLSL